MAGTKVVFNVRVTQDVADRIDKARGGQSRAGWVADAIEAALNGVNLAFAGEQVIPAKKVKDAGGCQHPKARVLKGFCYACGRSVL